MSSPESLSNLRDSIAEVDRALMELLRACVLRYLLRFLADLREGGEFQTIYDTYFATE